VVHTAWNRSTAEPHLQRLVLRVVPLPHELREQPRDHVAGHADDAGGAVVVPRGVRLVIVAAPRGDTSVRVALPFVSARI
jgi:hypothetical protein